MFSDYGRSLKQAIYPLPLMDNVVVFDVRTNTKEFDNNIDLQVLPNDLQDITRSNRWSQTILMCFVSMDSAGLSQDFHYRLTQVNIHPSAEKPTRYGPHEPGFI